MNSEQSGVSSRAIPNEVTLCLLKRLRGQFDEASRDLVLQHLYARVIKGGVGSDYPPGLQQQGSGSQVIRYGFFERGKWCSFLSCADNPDGFSAADKFVELACAVWRLLPKPIKGEVISAALCGLDDVFTDDNYFRVEQAKGWLELLYNKLSGTPMVEPRQCKDKKGTWWEIKQLTISPFAASVVTMDLLFAQWGERPADGPPVRVTDCPPQATINGTAYSLKKTAVKLLGAIVRANGDWVNGSGVVPKPDRAVAAMPDQVRKVIESAVGKGYRLRETFRHKVS
jgi:hypothetical protein